MKSIAIAAALLVAFPAVAQQRAMPGGDPDLDLSLRPAGQVKSVEADPDDDVFLPGLTEPAGAESAADMADYKGEGGPLEEIGYPLCSATITDRCVNPSG